MRCALRGSYVEVVYYMGSNERYPDWFAEELYRCTFTDDSNFTFWVSDSSRKPDYHEKNLIEDYSVFIRKPNGEVHVTDYDTFKYLYYEFTFDRFNNCGLAAFYDDVIEYVECYPGNSIQSYPDWFHDHFSEAIWNHCDGETIFISNGDDISVTEHTYFLQNKFGEISSMDYRTFTKYYDNNPEF